MWISISAKKKVPKKKEKEWALPIDFLCGLRPMTSGSFLGIGTIACSLLLTLG